MLAVLAALFYCFWVRMQTVRDYLTRDKIAKEVTYACYALQGRCLWLARGPMDSYEHHRLLC